MTPASAHAAALENRLGFRVQRFEEVGGGSINDCWRVTAAGGRSYFLKRNNAPKFPHLLSLEKAGLNLLAEHQLIHTPDVIDQWESETDQYLLLEWIAAADPTARFWEMFGQQLAALHRVEGNVFGGVADNYMGSVPQSNRAHDQWPDFFLEERLMATARRCVELGLAGSSLLHRIGKLRQPLEMLFADSRPALVHGDLWSGNFLCSERRLPVLIDPAAYWSDRSVDLAMTTLFGGFNARFYAAYHEAYPLPPQHRDQWELSNLYPLLVHLCLFGSSYAPAIEATLRRYAGKASQH